MKSKKVAFFFFLNFFVLNFYAESVFEFPVPKKYVNDYAQILTNSEEQALENRIIDFNSVTSNQIAVVTVKSLEGSDASDFAYQLAQKWGVGNKINDNGILILIKPKYKNERGQVYITVGYGLESAIPDIAVKRIVDNLIVPEFKINNYYEGIDLALSKLFELSKNEYSNSDEFKNEIDLQEYVFLILTGIITLLIPLFYIIYLKHRTISESLSFYYIIGNYNSKNITDQIGRIEKAYDSNLQNFKSQILKYEFLSGKNLFKYEEKIDNKIFCLLLNGRNRLLAFKEMADPFLIGILFYFPVLAISLAINFFFYFGMGASVIVFLITLFLAYALLNFLISILQIYQFVLRKKGGSSGGISIALFTLNSLFKRNVERRFDSASNSYNYYPLMTGVSYGGSSGGTDFGGVSFGGGSFGGGGAGGSW